MSLLKDQIPGQKRVKQILDNFLQSKKIPHAFLFTGIDGVGKYNAAIQFAKTLISKSKLSDSEHVITGITRLREPYIKLIFPLPRGKNEIDSSSPTEKLSQDEIELIREQLDLKAENPFYRISLPKANKIKINSIRDIKKFLSMSYDETSYRFILISDAHLMNDEAQNSLLKNLEEPPVNVIFIIITSMISKLKSTIISRCWRINFDPLSEDDVVLVLTKYYKIDETIAKEVAPFSMGSVKTALNLIEIDFHNLKEKTISILRYSFGRKFQSAFDELNSVISDKNSASFQIAVGMIITWLNDIQRHRLNIDEYYFKDHVETFDKFNNKFPDVNLNVVSSRLDKLSNLPQNNINPSILSANLIFELASVVLN